MEKVTIKELTDKQIDNLSDIQLYNILFGTGIEYKNKYKSISKEEKEETVLVLLGCDISGIKRLIHRMNALIGELEQYEPEKVVFSGGMSNRFKITPQTLPEERNKIIGCIEARVEKLNNFWSNDLGILTFKDYLLDKLEKDEEYSKYSKEYKEYILREWLQVITESEIMEYLGYVMYDNNLSNVIKESKSEHTKENMDYSFELIKKSCKKEKSKIAIITDWKHITRAMLTAKQVAKERKEPLELFSVVADIEQFSSVEQFRNYAKMEIKKMRDYKDVYNEDITKNINKKEKISGGPEIFVIQDRDKDIVK